MALAKRLKPALAVGAVDRLIFLAVMASRPFAIERSGAA
jgi:hypothetical protein